MMIAMSDKPTIQERYQRAIGDGTDNDVMGAFGLADRRLTAGWVPTGKDGEGYPIPKAPLAVALERLFGGDGAAAGVIVELLAAMVWSRADRGDTRPKLTRPGSVDMARAVLAWHRDGVCKACGGHGYDLIPGAPSLSERECVPCHGSGKLQFEAQFVDGHRELARWLLSEILREAGRAGPEAMRALAPKLEL